MIQDNYDSQNKELISKWLCEVIHREVSKPDDEADFELIDECEKTLSCLNDSDKLSENELKERFERITGESNYRSASTHKIKAKSIRRVALIAACLAAVMLVGVVTVCAFDPSMTDYVRAVLAGKVGYRTEMDGITFIYNGNTKKFSTVDELLSSEEIKSLNIILPIGLPPEMAISEIEILYNEWGAEIYLAFSDKSISLSIDIKKSIDTDEAGFMSEKTLINGITSYISEENGVYCSITAYGSNVYYITSDTKDKIITILNYMIPEE